MAEFLNSLTSLRSRRGMKIKREIAAAKSRMDTDHTVTALAAGVAAPLSRPLMVALVAVATGIVLIPVAYMPFASVASEWVRQTIIFLVTLVGLVAALTHIVRRKTLSVPRQWLPLALFLGVGIIAIVSALASSTRYLSLYGYDGTEGHAATTLFAFAVIASLVAVLGASRRALYHAWLIGSFVAMALSLVSLYGLRIFPGAPVLQWTPFGSTLTLVIVAALTIVGAYGVLTEYRPSRRMYLTASVTALTALAVLVSVNNRYGFFVLAGGSLVFLVGAALRKEEILSRAMMAPCIGLFLSVAYLLMAIPSIVSTPLEVNLSLAESARVARASLSRNPILGSGAGTFANEFFALRQPNITRSGFGETEFSSSAGMILTSVVTLGMFGALAVAAFVVLSLVRGAYGIVRDRRTGTYLAIQSTLVTALGAALILPIHPTIVFFIAIFLGLSLAEGTYAEISMARSERGIALRNGAVAAVLLILVIGTVVLVRRTGGVYFAVQAARAYAQNPAATATGVARALAFDNGHDGYWRMMSDARRAQFNALKSQMGNTAPSPEVMNVAQQLASQMVEAAMRSTTLAPGSARNWSSLGQAKLVAGVGNAAVLTEAKTAFERARELNPHDPAIITALGVTERLISLANAGSGKPDNTKAVALLQEAITLQPAYVGAHLELARLHAAAGEEEKATAAYGNARLAAPYDPRVAYEVALYLRDRKQTQLAIAELERAVRLAPNFADARFILSDMYAETGDYAKAIAHTEELLKLYPNNPDLEARLKSFQEKAAVPKKKK